VPLAEAMACQKPVVTTDLANHREIVYGTGNELLLLPPKVKVGEVNNGTPILVPESQRIYGVLKWLLENRDEANAYGINGRRKVLEQYDLTKVAVGWKKLFHSLVPEGYDIQTEMAKRMLTL
jgi:glycosyltransferase involved in cell wall biosynthesis